MLWHERNACGIVDQQHMRLVTVVAHTNSLRALLGVLCEVEDDQMALSVLERLPTGT
jgi:bisphosphoglycerate-dependent phosphoglycerate mutase